MNEENNFIIIDVQRVSALYGIGGKTLRFSTRDIAREVAIQFFKHEADFIVVEINVNK